MTKASGRQSDLNGFLDKGSDLRGELCFEAHFRVDGRFTGSVTSEGELIVGEGGEVDGELKVGQVLVSGIVRGSIQASRRVHITATGRVFADLDTPSLILEDGAILEGHCSMSRDPKSASGPKLVAPKIPVPREA